MQSLYLEACGEWGKLNEFHEQIRKDDEFNEAILKREVTNTSLLAMLPAVLPLGCLMFSWPALTASFTSQNKANVFARMA